MRMIIYITATQYLTDKLVAIAIPFNPGKTFYKSFRARSSSCVDDDNLVTLIKYSVEDLLAPLPSPLQSGVSPENRILQNE